MAMSVAESMQLGLIPLVTNVGQIKNYCKNHKNSIIYNENDKEVIQNIFELINSREKFLDMRKNILILGLIAKFIKMILFMLLIK